MPRYSNAGKRALARNVGIAPHASLFQKDINGKMRAPKKPKTAGRSRSDAMHAFFKFDETPWDDLGDGIRRKLIAWSDSLMAVCVQFDKGAVGTVHSHDIHDQIAWVAAGSFEIRVGEEVRVLRTGDAYMAVKGVAHGAVALEQDSMLIDIFSPKRADFLPG